MSGPKVINIEARRRQLQRKCLSRLRELKDAVAEWRTILERAGKLTAKAEEQANGLLRQQIGLSEPQDWGALADELLSRTQFFRTEATAVRNGMVQRAKSLHERRRRVEISALMLSREIRALGEQPPTELEWAIETVAKAGEQELPRLENTVQATFGRVALARSRTAAGQVSERQREIARRFKPDGTRALSLDEWVDAQSRISGKAREKNNRLDAMLAEVEAWDEGDAVVTFLERAKVISMEAQPGRRELLTDSLILDLSEFRTACRRAGDIVGRIRKALALLEPFDSETANEFRVRLQETLSSGGGDGADDIAAATERWCAEEAKREDARLRREALLEALGELGYEVREGMTAVWAQAGRIVVSKPGETYYGVELMSPSDTAAIQTRVVAFEHASRSSGGSLRDKEVEEAWCSDFERARAFMSGAGFETLLRQTTPAGAVKLKVVPAERTRSSKEYGAREQLRS